MPSASLHANRQTIIPTCTRRLPNLVRVFAMAWLLVPLGSWSPPASARSAGVAPRPAQQSIEHHKIEYLIAAIAELGNASFIRNGHAYDAGRAAEHMRLKWRLAGSRVKTARDFIRYCATASSTSGSPYTIRFADGRTVQSATFLQKKLAKYGSTNAPAASLQQSRR